MKYTSAEAAKLLRKLNSDLASLNDMENQSREFLASVGEDPETVRPEYDYAAVQEESTLIEGKIRTVKHAINVFNTTHKVPGFDMTIDEMLVYIPQLTNRSRKLYDMKSKLPKTRDNAGSYGRGGNIIDYRYANYDIKAAEADYEKITDELSRAQTALDLINSTETIDIEI